MPGTRRTLGYKPVNDPSGYGEASAGTMRGTTFAGRNTGYWITRAGERSGKQGATNTTKRIAIYQADKNTWVPGALLASTAAFTVTKVMADRASGGEYEMNITGGPVMVDARQPITLASLGTGGDWAHGQDNSGAVMHERGGLSSPPGSFGSTNSRPEGAMSLWAVTYDNVAPTIPLWDEESGGVSPGHGHTVVDDTPTIEFDFRSINEVLPGFSIGDADVMTAYQVQVYNASMSTKLMDSGKQTATTPMRNNRRATWTVPSELEPGQYVIRAQVFNAFGTASSWREWTINIVGAGSIVATSPNGVINDDTPDIGWNYTHRQSLAMDALRARIMNRAGTVPVRDEVYFDLSPDPVSPSTGTIEWGNTGWAALPKGEWYSIQLQAVDTDGQPSPWSTPHEFRLNAPPYVPINREPLPGSVLTSIPELSAMARDSDNTAATSPTEFEVRKVGSGASVTKTGIYNRVDNRWRLNLITEAIISPGDYGDWEWRTRSTDQYGAVGEWSSWLTFEYAAPPTVTVVEPTGTVAVANPAFNWTVDRTQTAYRIQLTETDTGSPIRYGDTGWITSATTEHTYPSLLLRHEQEITARIDVITSGNIPGFVEWEFDVAYTPPATVTGLTAETVQMPYDYQNTKTGVLISWDAVIEDEDEPFSGYRVQRRNTITGNIEPLVVIRDINQTEWLDETTPSGGPFVFEVMQEVWNSLDLIPSNPATVEVSVERIVGVVITPVTGGGEGVVLPYWDSLTIDTVQDKTVRSSWAAKPRVSSGPMNYRVLSGSAYLFGDPIEGRYTDTDLREAIHSLSDPFIDTDGTVKPNQVCVRLWDGRVVYGTIMPLSEGDWGSGSGNAINTNITRRTMRITVTETNFTRGGS